MRIQKRKMKRIICLLGISVMLFASCGEKRNGVAKVLDSAEAILYTSPDSALSLIGSIPIEMINSQHIQARFFLLYEQILDRNGITLIGEEYMQQAADYFDRSGSAKEKFLAHFYLGELYCQNGDKYGAMQQYVIAEDILRKSGKTAASSGADHREFESGDYPVRLYIRKGDIYMERMNPHEAVKMYEKALAECGDTGLSGNGETDSEKASLKMKIAGKLADGYQSIDKYDEALSYYETACNLAIDVNSKEYLLKCLTAIEGIKFSTGTPSADVLEELDMIYEKYNDGKPLESNYIMLSCLHLDNKNIAQARHFLNEYRRITPEPTPVEEAGLCTLSSSIEKAEGNFKEALLYEQQYNAIMGEIMEQEKANSLTQIEQAYHAKQLAVENDAIRTRNRHLFIIYTLVLVIVVFAASTGFFRWRRKLAEKNGQIKEYLEQLKDSEISNNGLLTQLDVHKEKEKHLKELLENRFAEIRELACTYYEFGYSKKLQKKVEQLLSLQSIDGDMFDVIEEVVNAKNNGVIEKIRATYPSISESNIKLLDLIYAGFSPQEISVILNDTPQNIYVRKSRLKRKIMPLVEQDPEMDFK